MSYLTDLADLCRETSVGGVSPACFSVGDVLALAESPAVQGVVDAVRDGGAACLRYIEAASERSLGCFSRVERREEGRLGGCC